MKKAKVTHSAPARLPLRAEQALLTRRRIEDALVALLHDAGAVDGITFKGVAERAGVTEMTVYRHFPTRDDLLAGLWERINREMGPGIRMPEGPEGLLAQHEALFRGFDAVPALIEASLTTPQGRAMRAALNRKRRAAFLAIVDALAPALDPAARAGAAGVIQLLHSAHAWASLREQWGMDGEAAARATRWAIEALFDDLRRTT